MSITSYIDTAKDLTTFTVASVLSFDEVMPVVKAFYDGDPTKNVMWNLLDDTDVQLTSEQGEVVVRFSPRYEGTRASGKTAFVAQQDLLFGLLRMFEMQSEGQGAPFPTMVFRNKEEAYKWFDKP